ncbi:MAG: serine/threonine protein kinase [Deltaproteobacteria bacterium]|nr:serine/threonine protein kinase [Deltaproteobacteria bacterium]
MNESEPARTRYCSRCITTFFADEARCPNLGCRHARPAVGWGELMEAGDLLDRTYRIHSRLAIGGAGVTYLGRELGEGDEETGPLLALKVLYQQRDQGAYLHRLATEANVLQRLNHPQIVECRGFVHRSGHSPYLVTRFEAGGSLLDHIRRVGTLSVETTAAIGVQICDALGVAHRQGVIHRDLKPENVLLETIADRDEVPRVRVADFGIAKVIGGVGDRLTRVGAFVGTAQYAAPEQFEGMTPEPATDVYAVGALLYFCLTARPVAEYMAELDAEDQRYHLLRHLPPRLPQLDGPPGRWIEDSLAGAMTPEPGDRCAIEALAARLLAIAAGRDPGPIHTGSAPPTSGVTADSGPVDITIFNHPKGAPVGARSAPTSVPTLDEPTASQTSRAPAGVTLRPVPTIERMAAAPAARTAGVGCLAGGLLLVSLGLALGGALWWFTHRDTSRALTASDPDATARKEWQAIAYQVGVEGVRAERACQAPPYLGIEVTLDATGSVTRTRLLNYPHAPTEECVGERLAQVKFPRSSAGSVRVAVTMTE